MKIWHDRSWISENSRQLIESGFAVEDLHSLRLCFTYTEKEQADYRRFSETHTVEERNQDNAREAQRRSKSIYEVVRAISEKFCCYQFEDDLPFDEDGWDLFFWCNGFHTTMHGYGLTGRDYSYVTLTFNDKHSPTKKKDLCGRVLDIIQKRFPDHPNLDLAIQYDVLVDQEKVDNAVAMAMPRLVGQPCTYANMVGKVVRTDKGVFFLKQRCRKYGYRLDQVDLLRLAGLLPMHRDESEVRYA